MNGLKIIWRSDLPFDDFKKILENQGYTWQGQWMGTSRELRALYERLKGSHINSKVSRTKFFELAKNTFSIHFKCATSLKFDEWDFEEELKRLEDIF